MFKMEQEEYSREGIDWQYVEFIDNQEVVDMLSRGPMNFIALLDEESRFPRVTKYRYFNTCNVIIYRSTIIY